MLMHPSSRVPQLGHILVFTLVAVTVAAATASAQSRLYIGGTALADVRQFDSIELDPRILASVADIGSRDGIAAGGGVRVGTFLHPVWSLELAVDAGSRSSSSVRNPIELMATRSSTLRLPELSSGTSFLTVSTVVGFHPQKTGRVRMGYLGGVALVRGTYETTFPRFSYTPIELAFVTGLPSFARFESSLSSLTQPVQSSTSGDTFRRIDNSIGGVMGLEAAVDMTRRLSLVPGVRTIVFSNLGQTVFLIRPEAGVRWSF